MEHNLKKAVESGKITAEQVADHVLTAIQEKHFLHSHTLQNKACN